MATGEERFIREERVKSSVKEAEKDLVLKESALEPVRMVTKDLQEGKGIVFSYPAEEIVNNTKGQGQQGEKIMDSAIRANPAMRWRTEQQSRGEVFSGNLQTSESSSSGSGSTGSRLKSFDLNLSGTSSQKFNIRKKPGKNKRNQKVNAAKEDNIQISLKEGVLIGSVEKRKATDQMGGVSKAIKQITHEAIPKEGLSKDQ